MPGGNDLNLFSERSSVRKQEPRRSNWGGTCQIKNNHKTKAYGKRRTKHELNSVEPINFEIGSSQYSFLQFPAPSWKAAVPFHWSETNGDLAMIETFFNTLDNYSHVSIIARSPLVSLRRNGSATFQDGAGNCKKDYWSPGIWTGRSCITWSQNICLVIERWVNVSSWNDRGSCN